MATASSTTARCATFPRAGVSRAATARSATLQPRALPGGTACGFLWFEGDLNAACVAPEPLPAGTPCGSTEEDLCGAGQICVSAPFAPDDCADTFCCVPLCNFQDGALCPDGGECFDFLAMSIFGNQVGICVPP
ncbi:hypothetical protein [Nannocystis pusilla]|uniref:hypothetical protein n=1 Tax=Nannocystis pusilla TaxID=889268 RepID=UPI003B7C09EB